MGKEGFQEEQVMTDKKIPPCMIYIDKEGQWFHKGVEMIHRNIIRHFYEHMEMDSEGRYIISWHGECCHLEVEDTAYTVRRAELTGSHRAEDSRISLYLSDDRQEELAPDTLYVGRDNVLYCRVREQTFPARFSRAAYYQLAEYLEEEDGRYFLPLNGRRYLL